MKTNRIVAAVIATALGLPLAATAFAGTTAPAAGLSDTLSAIKAGTVSPQASYVVHQKQFAQAQAVIKVQKKSKKPAQAPTPTKA